MEKQKIIKYPQIKLIEEDFEVDFEIEFTGEMLNDNLESNSSGYKEIDAELAEVDNILSSNYRKIEDLNATIDLLTNNSDCRFR